MKKIYKIIYVDFGLSGNIGHHLNHLSEFKNEVEKRGIAIFALGSTKFYEADHHANYYKPVFNIPLWTLSSNSQLSKYSDFLTVSDLFGKEITRVVDLFDADAVYFASAFSRPIMGVARAFHDFPERSRSIPIYFELNHNPDIISTHNDYCYESALYCIATEEAKKVFKNARFLVEDPSLYDRYKNLLSVDVDYIPMRRQSIIIEKSKEAIHILFAGYQSIAKGFHLIPEICLNVLSRTSENIFITVHNGNPSDTEYDEQLNSISKKHQNFRFIHDQLGENEYKKMISSAHIWCMPYDPKHYLTAPSATAHEALINECYAVVPVGSTLQKLFKINYAPHLTFESFDCDCISEQLLTAISCLDVIQHDLKLSAMTYSKEKKLFSHLFFQDMAKFQQQ